MPARSRVWSRRRPGLGETRPRGAKIPVTLRLGLFRSRGREPREPGREPGSRERGPELGSRGRGRSLRRRGRGRSFRCGGRSGLLFSRRGSGLFLRRLGGRLFLGRFGAGSSFAGSAAGSSLAGSAAGSSVISSFAGSSVAGAGSSVGSGFRSGLRGRLFGGGRNRRIRAAHSRTARWLWRGCTAGENDERSDQNGPTQHRLNLHETLLLSRNLETYTLDVDDRIVSPWMPTAKPSEQMIADWQVCRIPRKRSGGAGRNQDASFVGKAWSMAAGGLLTPPLF